MRPDINPEKTAEDYLEAMLMIQKKNGEVRSVDIARHLGITKPSVTYTTKRLKEKGYITMDKDNYITITESGMEIASKILHRHEALPIEVRPDQSPAAHKDAPGGIRIRFRII